MFYSRKYMKISLFYWKTRPTKRKTKVLLGSTFSEVLIIVFVVDVVDLKTSVVGLVVPTLKRGGQILLEGLLLAALRQGLNGPQAVHYVLSFAKVDTVKRGSDFIFHFLHHPTDIGYVGVTLVYSSILLYLK